MNVEDFLTKKGICSDTTIGIEGDYKLTDLMEEYAAQSGRSLSQNNKPLVIANVSVQCEHPRSQREYIGSNLLRCKLCGTEFK